MKCLIATRFLEIAFRSCAMHRNVEVFLLYFCDELCLEIVIFKAKNFTVYARRFYFRITNFLHDELLFSQSSNHFAIIFLLVRNWDVEKYFQHSSSATLVWKAKHHISYPTAPEIDFKCLPRNFVCGDLFLDSNRNSNFLSSHLEFSISWFCSSSNFSSVELISSYINTEGSGCFLELTFVLLRVGKLLD